MAAVNHAGDWLSKQTNASLVSAEDHAYPPRLLECQDAPAFLWVVGDLETLKLPQLAIVGSRNPSPQGQSNAREFAKYLAGRGLSITSGLALGIDGCAHQGALDTEGITIAVSATGPDAIYPKRHIALAEKILAEGAIVTEMPPGTIPRPALFPQRNRIIAGLSLGTLVVEAALRSGSLVTARLAMEYSREVFAIPGSIHNPLARGCHQLIRQGAKLVESAADIFEEIAVHLDATQLNEVPELEKETSTSSSGSDNEEQKNVIEAMGYDPISINKLAETTQMTVQSVSSTLLILELEGVVASCPGGQYQRITRS